MKMNEMLLREVCGLHQQYFAKPSPVCTRLVDANTLLGIEIELENFNDPDFALGKVLYTGWVEHAEGSLVNGREFVLYPPGNGQYVENAVNEFFGNHFEFTASERTSIHVHVDMTDDITVGQFRSVLALTYLIEPAIYRTADENRKWGSYSCPLIDMRTDRFLSMFAAVNQNKFIAALSGNYHEEKYYGCNAVSIRKHGTLEFRYFPCTNNKDVLLNYVNVCLELKKAGRLFNNPVALCDAVDSPQQLLDFMQKNMPVTYACTAAYIDVEDVQARVNQIRAICTDQNVGKVVRGAAFGGAVSPAIRRFLEARDKQKQQAIQDEAEQNMRLVDVMDILRQQQLAKAAGGQLKKFGVPNPFIAEDVQRVWFDEEAQAQRLPAVNRRAKRPAN